MGSRQERTDVLLWTNVLYLRPGTREHFLENLGRDWPELVPRYERQYAGRAFLPKSQVETVRREVADLRHRFDIADQCQVRLMPAPASEPDQHLQLDLEMPAKRRQSAVTRVA